MSPALKYTLARFGLFALLFVLLLPVPLNILIRAMIALVLSAIASYFLLAKWRDQMAERLGEVAGQRKAEKDRLRAALAGDETAAAEGDRAAEPKTAEPKTAEPKTAEPKTAEPKTAEPKAVEPTAAEPKAVEK